MLLLSLLLLLPSERIRSRLRKHRLHRFRRHYLCQHLYRHLLRRRRRSQFPRRVVAVYAAAVVASAAVLVAVVVDFRRLQLLERRTGKPCRRLDETKNQ